MTPVKLLHIAPWVKTTGGIETLLARHAQADAANGFAATQLALFDKQPAPPGQPYATQAFSWKSTPHGMRRAMARTLAAHAGSVIAWHNAWGVPWFADVDGSARRIICLQDGVTQFGAQLPGLAGLADGVTCLSESAARSVRKDLPGLPPERVVVLPLPLAPPAGLVAERPARAEWIIGCAGRLVRTQKRWDRLVPFVAELRRLGVNYRLEVVSDGPLRPWLERQLGADARIRFLGWQDTAAYWRRMQNWDAMVTFTDHEGGPIVLIEGMAAGVIPLYPAIGGSLGDDYAGGIDPRCHYPAGDAAAAARALQSLLASPPAEVLAMRRRAQALVQRHVGRHYEDTFAGFAHRIAGLPRLSREPRGGRAGRFTDRLPLGLLTRTLPGTLLR